jgi:hypothetical protein
MSRQILLCVHFANLLQLQFVMWIQWTTFYISLTLGTKFFFCFVFLSHFSSNVMLMLIVALITFLSHKLRLNGRYHGRLCLVRTLRIYCDSSVNSVANILYVSYSTGLEVPRVRLTAAFAPANVFPGIVFNL